MTKRPSIFNDVIGPVMRGPSSSHTAASWRIARVCMAIFNQPLKVALIDFDKDGAWATNYREQGTVLGISGGLLGLDITDDRMKETKTIAAEAGIEIQYAINTFPTTHANTVRLTLKNIDGESQQFIGISTGGGAFEIQKIDRFDISLKGDYFELLVWTEGQRLPSCLEQISKDTQPVYQSSDDKSTLTNIKFSQPVSEKLIQELSKTPEVKDFIVVDPVLPIVSGNEAEPPFRTVSELLDYGEKNQLNLGGLGLLYEQSGSGLPKSELRQKMESIITIIDHSIDRGLKGTDYADRILQQQSHLIEEAAATGKILQNSLLNKTIAYVTAIMESKSGMEVIVANPTAGSCGTIGGVVRAMVENLKSNSDDIINAYFAAGMVGVLFAQGPGFSAEEHGCQVECGAASGMAAAALVQLMGGTAKEAIAAASMAIQNLVGMICDPVADRVEVPCLGKNITAAMNTLSSTTMARSGFNPLIPLNEVIETVIRVGKEMPACVKCTGLGGLAVTDTSVEIKDVLKRLGD